MSVGVFHARGQQVRHRSTCLVHLRTKRRPEWLETVSRGTVLRGAIRSRGAHSNNRELAQSETGTEVLHSNSFPGFLGEKKSFLRSLRKISQEIVGNYYTSPCLLSSQLESTDIDPNTRAGNADTQRSRLRSTFSRIGPGARRSEAARIHSILFAAVTTFF